MRGREILGRAAEAVTFLFAMFSGFLKNVAPPEEANADFAVGLGSFMALVTLLFISVLARGHSIRRHNLWLAVAGALAIVALVTGLLYQRHLGALTFFYPPESQDAQCLVRGTHYTAEAQPFADQGLGPGKILAQFGPENINHVWSPESIENAKTILTVNYLILVLSLAATIFSLVEVYLDRGHASETTDLKAIPDHLVATPGSCDKAVQQPPAVLTTSSLDHQDLEEVQALLSGKREAGMFDVFLCHNSEDKPTVKRVGRILEQLGLLPWLDEWELRPGLPWQDLLEAQILNVKAAAVFVGPNGFGPWQNQEQRAFLRQFVDRQCPVIPVLLPECPTVPNFPPFLAGMTWVDLREAEPNPLERLVWGITDRRPDQVDDLIARRLSSLSVADFLTELARERGPDR